MVDFPALGSENPKHPNIARGRPLCETKQLFTRSEAVLNSLIGDGKCQGLGHLDLWNHDHDV